MNFFNYLACLLCLIFYSCTSSKSVVGIYRSNFAASGHFVEQVTLKEDSSFVYQSRSHALNQYAGGHYTLNHDKLILHYDFPLIDTSGTAYLTSLGFPIEDDRRRWRASFPRLFFIRNGKLLSSDIKGKIVRKARIKPFLKRPLKKYYLKQIHSIIGNLQVELTR